jgi:hypothetical protein
MKSMANALWRVRLDNHFGEMMADENRGPYFRLFDERPAAQEWLCFG